jgi:ATP-binding cassette, subfamily B, bacterial CvaB/MchF/RaxB
LKLVRQPLGLEDVFARRQKVPDLRQAEAAECGLVAIAMVAWYHGQHHDLAALRRRFTLSLKGATLKSLVNIAEGLGLSCRALRIEPSALPKLKLPCILHWDMNHFVVLTKVSKTTITIMDPAQGERRYTLSDASPHLTGAVLELTPSPAFHPAYNVAKMRLADLWSRATGLKKSLLQLLAIAVVLEVFALASPLVNQIVVDEAITKGDMNLLTVLALGFALLIVIQATVQLFQGWVGMYVSNSLSFQMEVNLFRHLLRLPSVYFERRHTGDIVSRFGSLAPIQNLLTSGAVSALLDGTLAIATLVLMFIYSWKLALIPLVALLLNLAIRFATLPFMRGKTGDQIQADAKEQSLFLESLRAQRAIKIFGREDERGVVWQNAYVDSINAHITLSRFGLWGGLMHSLLWGGEALAILFVGAKLIMANKFTLGMLFAFQSYSSQFSGRALALVDRFMEFRMLGLHLARIADIAHTPQEIGLIGPEQYNRPIAGEIELRDISFKYAPFEPWILRHLDLHIKAGECVVITGVSGGGKTTMLKLLLGLMPPTEGEIKIDNYPLLSVGLKAYRRALGVVMQDDVLLSGTIADNICFFDPEMNMARVHDCATQASIHEDIMRLPMTYHSLVGDMGSSLSGGQKQRVLLARALYHQPSILVLDEGTANLDEDTEAVLLEAVKSMPITRIIIAHRHQALRIADRVLQLVNGQLTDVTNPIPLAAE